MSTIMYTRPFCQAGNEAIVGDRPQAALRVVPATGLTALSSAGLLDTAFGAVSLQHYSVIVADDRRAPRELYEVI